VVALVTVTLTAAAIALVVGPGYQTSQVRMHPGAVWLASTQTGEATLLDGSSAEVKAHVPVAAAGAALSVVQRGGAAVVLNRETGELSGVDGATERVSPPVEVLPASAGLVVLPSPNGLYTVDVHSGQVVAVDPATLAPRGEPVRLAEAIRPDSAVVDGHGRLWAIDDTTGDLVWLSEGQRRTRSTASKTGRLTITGGRPAMVDPERGTAELLDPSTGAVESSARPDLRADDTVVVGGSADQARVLITTGSRGELITCAFGTGSCGVPVQVGSAGSELGTAVEVDGHAVVPDYSTGQATIVNLATSQVIAQRQLFDRPTRFELLVRDGIVFFNDANGDRAGVLELSGDVRAITKYTGKPAEEDVPLTQNTPAQPNQATKVGHGKQKPGVGVAGRTVQPSRVEPGPGPVSGASIVVKPGNQGVVGDEFELTIVVPSPPGSTTTAWQFGDGTEATGGTVRHSWRQAGTFTVNAISTFDNGARAEAETTVIVDPPEAPVRITALNVRRPKPVIGESVRFSADATAKPDGWVWTITRPGSAAAEATARTAEFTHTFSTPGTYTVALTVSAGKQATQSSRQFTVVRGIVKGWGHNHSGESVPPPSASSGVVAIDAGYSHALALKANGAVIAWGNTYGGVTAVPEEATSGVVAIAAGAMHNVALKADGSIIAWGSNNMGELNVPAADGRAVVAIAAGASHSLALKADGSVIGWGHNSFGALDIPPAALSGVIAISAGGYTSMALKADGSVIVWGDNCAGEAPVTGAVAISAGNDVCVALKRDGSVVAWGNGGSGELQVPPAAMSDVIAIDAHMVHVLALKSDGTAVGWGWNNADKASVPPPYNKGVLAVSAGSYFSLALLEGLD
jgi:hypothetical protein